jgi:hypothetical protein
MQFTGWALKGPDDRMLLSPEHPEDVRKFLRTLEGERLSFWIEKFIEQRTLRQIRGFHAMLAPWAKDRGHTVEDLKSDLMGEVFGWNEKVSPLTHRLMPLRPHTSTLNIEDYGHLIEQTLLIAAEDSYLLESPSEYRERKLMQAKE